MPGAQCTRGRRANHLMAARGAVDGVTGRGLASKRAALATALFSGARRAACLEGRRSSLTLMV
jgi:hypothetical protein